MSASPVRNSRARKRAAAAAPFVSAAAGTSAAGCQGRRDTSTSSTDLEMGADEEVDSLAGVEATLNACALCQRIRVTSIYPSTALGVTAAAARPFPLLHWVCLQNDRVTRFLVVPIRFLIIAENESAGCKLR